MVRLLRVTSYVMVLTLGMAWGAVGTSLYYERCPAAGHCPAVKAPVCAKDIKHCSVQVRTPSGGHGSGTIGYVDGELFVLTAEHVASLDDEVEVGLERAGEVGLWLKARCVHASIKNDLALLKLDYEPVGPWPDLCVADTVELDEPVVYCGWGGWAPLYLEHSRVQNEWVDFRPELGYACFLVGGNGQAGNSGSAVWVVRKGRYVLAGVILRGWSNGAPIICIHPSDLSDFLREKPKEKAKGGWIEIIVGR